KVIILRYYRDKTQSEIAQLLGVSQVQISRIESKVISQLKQALA
ncbi:MAG: helix-turn-helix domain-containing protein, partial [Clostridia bacterium]|nr:helix-turn-helix domain-containing protein [Clostridia bacterium]